MRVRIRHSRLAEKLARRNLSQNAWALRIGISAGHLSNLVSGRRPYVNKRTQRKLLEALGARFEELFEIEADEASQRPPAPAIDWRLGAWQLQLRRTESLRVPHRARPGVHLFSDLRLAVRSFALRPGFTAVVVLTLGLGLGVGSTAFTVLNSVLLQPLGFPEPENIVRVFGAVEADGQRDGVSFHNLKAWIDNAKSFDAFADYRTAGVTISNTDGLVNVQAMRVTEGFFDVFGVEPRLGRVFAADEYADGWSSGSVVLSEGLWRRHFGADPDILGTTISVDDKPHVVVGVMPAAFRVTGPWGHRVAEVWTAHSLKHWLRTLRPGARAGNIVARIQSGVDPRRARDELHSLRVIEGPEVESGSLVLPLLDIVTEGTRPLVWLLAVLATFVLVVAGINYSTLLLANGLRRHHEVAVRRAMGAGTWALCRTLALEALLCSLAGAGIGLAGAWLLASWIAGSAPTEMPRLAEAGIDWTVFGVALGLAAAVAVVSSVVPGLWMGWSDVVGGLKRQKGQSSSRIGRRLGRALVTAQIALAFALLAGGVLFANSYWKLITVEPGFRNWNLIATTLGHRPSDRGETLRDRTRQLEEFRARLEAVDGVTATAVGPLPFRGSGVSIGVVAEGGGDTPVTVNLAPVTHDYFRTLNIPLMSGLSFRKPIKTQRPKSPLSMRASHAACLTERIRSAGGLACEPAGSTAGSR